MADEVKVRISATDGTGPGFQEATSNADAFTEHMEKGFERVAERLVELFAVEKIADFFKEAVVQFADVQRSMDILDISLNNNGKAWGATNEQIENFVKSQEILGGQSKEQIIGALTDINVKVGDLHISLGLLDEAQKLSLISGDDLKSTSEALGRAFEGDSRGIKVISRDLTGNATALTTAGEAFETLDKKIAGVGAVADDAKGHLNEMKVSFETFSEFIGGTFAPLIEVGTAALRLLDQTVEFLIVGFKDVADIVVADVGIVIDEFKAASEVVHGFYDILHGKILDGFAEIGQGGVDAFNAMSKGSQNALTEMGKDWDDFAKRTNVIWGLEVDQAKGASEAEIKADAEANQKKAEARKAALEAAKEAAANKKKLAEEEAKAEENLIRQGEAQIRLQAEEEIKYVQKVAEARKKALEEEKRQREELDKALLSNADKLSNDLIALEKTKGKEGLEIAKDIAVIKAIINTAAGITQALSDYPYPASLAVGALVAAEGAVEIGKIEGALDTGGIVTHPTLSWIGEKRPEAVIPLEELPKYTGNQAGAGYSIGEIHVHGVQDAARFVRALPANIQRANARQGYRLATT